MLQHASKSRAELVAEISEASAAIAEDGRDSALADGVRVCVHSLTSAEGVQLNGLAGTVVGFVPSSGRYKVKVDGKAESPKALKPESLRLLPKFTFSGSGGGSGSGSGGGGSSGKPFVFGGSNA
eukprot:SAG22_NODE_2258_length_2779_cov_1.213433_3_plen_124_part_00